MVQHSQTYSYVDLSTIKALGNLNIAGTGSDDMLLFWAENCSKFIEEFLHTQFYCFEGIKYFNGASSVINLPLDLLSISDFALDLDGSGTYGTSVAATDYVLEPTWTYPKRTIKRSLLSTVGTFASNVPNGIRITGVWGYGTGETATPYQASGAVVNTGNITASATTHALATGKGALFAAGMTIRIGTEQLYVTGVSTDTLTFMRGANGTTAAVHTSGDVIYIYIYHSNVVAATLIQLSIWWKRRESAYASKVGDALTGQYETYKGLDDGVRQMLLTGKLKRHVL